MKANSLLRVLNLIRPFWRAMLLATLLGVLTIASSMSLMATSAWLISKAALQPSIAELGVAVVGVRFFGIARGVFRYLERVVAHETTFRLLAHLRVEFYKAVEPVAPAGLTSVHSGDLLNRVISDIENLQNLYLRAVAPPVAAVLIALLLTVFLNLFDPLIALVALTFMLAAGIFVPLLAWWGNEHAGRQQVGLRADLNASLIDQIQGMAETLAYGKMETQVAHLAALSQRLAAEERRTARIDALQIALSVLISNSAAAAVLALAIPRVEGIYLATVALVTIAAFEAFNPLAQAAVELGANTQSAQRLFEIADLPAVIEDPAQPAPVPERPAVNIRNLSFRYTGNAPLVLEDFSLELPFGQRIAILGESGSGKSTLINLLLRFWDYDTGQIFLGERTLKDYSPTDIRNLFGVMTQRTHLFNTSIRENIWIARSDAAPEEVEAAARDAQIHDFILSLPDGYDTYAGEDGSQLSGGQRQRIALARVLLKKSPILILDEATANLDVMTERAVMQTILQTTVGRSLLMFTHRPVFLSHMDQVYLLRDKQLKRIPRHPSGAARSLDVLSGPGE